MIIGLVVIILAALVIRNMLSGNSDYSIQVSSNIVLGETATATLVGRTLWRKHPGGVEQPG